MDTVDTAEGRKDAEPTVRDVKRSHAPLLRRAFRAPLMGISKKSVYGTLSIVLLVLAWWISSALINNPLVMPRPGLIARTIVENFTTTDPLGATGWEYLATTLRRILFGFALSMVIGTVVGVLMGTIRVGEHFLTPLVTIGLTMPAIAWTILGILWFGINEFMGLFNLVMVVTPFVVVSVWEGTKAVDRDLVEMSRVFGSSSAERVRRIYLPHLSPFLFAAVRYGFALCWKIILVTEIFGLPGGVGTILNFWYQQFDIAQVFAWTITFGLVILAVENLIVAPVRRRTFRWKPEALVGQVA